jgi:O-antigen/teichoic acid export membrane protein
MRAPFTLRSLPVLISGWVRPPISDRAAERPTLRSTQVEGPVVQGAAVDEGRRRRTLATYTSLTHIVAMAAQAATSIATVRLTLPYLGEDRFGAWMTVMGITGLLTFADLGIGNALITRVAAARAQAAGVPGHVAVTGGLACLFAVGAVVSLATAAVCAVIPWGWFLGKHLAPSLETEFRSAAMLLGMLFGAFLFTSGVRKVYEGLQQGYIAHAVMAVSSGLSLALLFFAARQRGGIPLLIAVTFGMTALLPLALMVPLIRAGYFRGRSILSAGRHEWRQLLGAGSQYSVVQVGSLLLTGSEPMLVASMQGPAAYGELAVVQRLFQIALTPIRVLVAPYWGAYADAYARGDFGYLRKTLVRQVTIAGISTLVIAALVTWWSDSILAAWTKQAMAISPRLILACCVLCLFDGAMLPFGIYLNGIGCVRPQAMATAFALFTYFPAKVWALAYGGAEWMIWTTIAFQIGNTLLFYAILYREQVWHAVRSR